MAADNVLTYLQAMVKAYDALAIGREGWRYQSAEELVLDRGEEHVSYPYPRRWRRGMPKDCFRNAKDLVGRITSVKLTYVEGFAYSHGAGFTTMHGWAIDEEKRVYDSTWDHPEFNEYFGIAIPEEEFARRLMRTSLFLPLLDDWANDFRNLQRGWDDAE